MAQFPKKSLLTGRLLEFRNIESYYFQDFATRNDMQIYVKSLSLEQQKEYCESLMRRRLEIKESMYLPSQLETLSLMMPSAKFYNRIFGDYYKFGRNLGISSRFRHLTQTERLDFDVSNETIIIDTREQLNFKFKGFKREVHKLDYGDYKLNSGKAVIERKGISDFVSSFGSQFDRLIREFDRAKTDGGYIYVIIEESLSNALKFNTLQSVSHKVRATPDFVFKNVRDAMQSYDNVQFIFMPNRSETEKWIPIILKNHALCSQIDMQLYFDSNV
jgi:hypothetical protein